MMEEPKKIRPVFLNISQKIRNRDTIFQPDNSPKMSEETVRDSLMYSKLIKRLHKLEETEKSEQQEH